MASAKSSTTSTVLTRTRLTRIGRARKTTGFSFDSTSTRSATSFSATEGYSEIDPEIIGVTTYPSYAAAEQACEQLQLKYSVAGPDMQGGWLRIDEGPFQTHFQFQDGALFRVTLSAHDAQ